MVAKFQSTISYLDSIFSGDDLGIRFTIMGLLMSFGLGTIYYLVNFSKIAVGFCSILRGLLLFLLPLDQGFKTEIRAQNTHFN